jgi:hypothetical protein
MKVIDGTTTATKRCLGRQLTIVHKPSSGRFTGQPECAGINRHVVGDERALQERRQRLHPGLESCRRDREVSLEA